METPGQLTSGGAVDVRRLAAQVARSRAALVDSVEALVDRLRPSHWTARARTATVGRTALMMNRAGASIRRHPLPYAAVALGMGAALGARRLRLRRRSVSALEAPEAWREGEPAPEDRHAEAHDVGRGEVTRTRRTWASALQERPLLVGLAAFAAGALLGTALPPSAFEDELFGDTRDWLFDSARAFAEQKAQQFAEGY
jgi:hypothetical protein